MKCFKCGGVGKVRCEEKAFCGSCFCQIIEKRVRKEIRQGNLLSKNDKVLILDDNSERSALTKYLLKSIISDPTISVKIKKISAYDENKNYNQKNKFDKVAIPWVLEDEAKNYIKFFLENKKTKIMHEGDIIKPLIGVLEREAAAFAKIKNIKFKKSEKTKDDIEKMIEKMDKKYPGTKFSILKTIRKTI